MPSVEVCLSSTLPPSFLSIINIIIRDRATKATWIASANCKHLADFDREGWKEGELQFFWYWVVQSVEYRYNTKEYSIDGPQQEAHPQRLAFQASKGALVEQEGQLLKIEGKPATSDQGQASPRQVQQADGNAGQ